MKLSNQLSIPLASEAINTLKVYPSWKTGQNWTRPVSINLLITSRCNSKCITCDSWKLTEHSHELSLENFTQLAKECAHLGIPIVTIGGGEPTLRQDIWDIVKAFKQEGLVVQLTTNGLTMRQAAQDAAKDAKLDRMTISYDSHIPALYEKIRGVPGVKKIDASIKQMLEDDSFSVDIDTNTVLCSDNADTFLDTIDHLIALGVPKINFSAVTTSSDNYLMTETKESLAQIDLASIDKITEGLLKRKRSTGKISASSKFIEGLPSYYKTPNELVYPCLAGYLTIDVFDNGDVHGCGNLPNIGNVKTDSLQSIWRGETAAQNRKDMAAGNCPNCYLSCKIELAIAGNPRFLPMFAAEKLGLR